MKLMVEFLGMTMIVNKQIIRMSVVKKKLKRTNHGFITVCIFNQYREINNNPSRSPGIQKIKKTSIFHEHFGNYEFVYFSLVTRTETKALFDA